MISKTSRSNPSTRAERVSVRSAKVPFWPDFAELWAYRDVVRVLVWRDIKVRFSHTVLGILWYILQPFLLMVVITVGFKFVLPAAVNGLPYPLFVSSGLIVWLYFSNAVTGGASSFEKFQGIINKVYLPKLALPLASITATLADLLAAALLLVPLMFYYRIIPSWRTIFIPIVIFGLLLFVAGLVLFLSVACMKYKDLRHVLPFTMQLLFFGSPIFVPQSLLPEKVKMVFSLNPLGGYIDSFRWALFDSAPPPQVRSLVLAGVVTLVLLLVGLLYFQRQQADLVDII